MRIAINTRFLAARNLEGLGRFAYETSRWMVTHHPEHEYFFLFDRPFDRRYTDLPRVTPLLVPPPARHPFLWYIWYEWAVPYVLQKNKIDLFISTDGLGSLRSKVPSCTVIHDLAFAHFPDQVSRLTHRYYRYFIPRYMKSAHLVATVSEASKKDMTDLYGLPAARIDVVESACSEAFHPQPEPVRQATIRKYTGGHDFFIFTGAISPRKNVLNILEAYTIFRQAYPGQKVKLVLVGRKAWMTGDFDNAMRAHPFQEDILHFQGLEISELVKLLGSALASLYPSLLEGFGLPILEAQKSHVPVITSDRFSMPEVAGKGALLVDPHQPADIAQKMGMLFVNETLRRELVAAGADNWSRYSWSRTASLLYDCAMKCVADK